MNSFKSIRGGLILCNSIKFQRCFGTCFVLKGQASSAKIDIPKAIPRGPTDILAALAETVNPDFSGSRYEYIDDPLLTPQNFMDKKIYLYSKEAGRKAARYFFDKYPQYFHRDISEPKIEAFTYKEIYRETMEFEIYDLEQAVIGSEVNNAMVCYKGLRKQGVEIDPEMIYDLLDLVCFYNSDDPPERQLDNEWFQSYRGIHKSTGLMENQWKSDSFADELFENIEPKSSRAYSSMILGLCKHGDIQRAFAIYRKAIEQGCTLNTATYNSLIDCVDRLHGTNDERWKEIMAIYRTMQKNAIRPDLETMHNTLEQIEKCVFWAPGFEKAKNVYNELSFKFNIVPTRRTNSLMKEIQNGMNRKKDIDSNATKIETGM